MSWEPYDDEPVTRRRNYSESSGLCNCDDCNRPIREGES